MRCSRLPSPANSRGSGASEFKPHETGHALVERIRIERKRYGSNGRRRRRAVEESEKIDDEFPQLPDAWANASFGELFDLYTGSTPSRANKEYWNGDIPWVSSGEVAFCRINDTAEKITVAGLNASSTRVHPVGTVLLAMIGEGKTRGQCAILDAKACNNQNAAAIHVSETPILPEFVFDFLQYRYEKTRRDRQGGNQPALNLRKVANIQMPVPPISEMHEIVDEVRELLSLIDDVATTVGQAHDDALKLRQSILKAAFEGHLVEQNPRDEPADRLLARLSEQNERPPNPALRNKRAARPHRPSRLK